uniref:Uncharacterized protein n=1 Tax=Anguilla anguilla TaxID=7936 RepID=A0A0E9W2S2_ANGAN
MPINEQHVKEEKKKKNQPLFSGLSNTTPNASRLR